MSKERRVQGPNRRLNGSEGVDFVRCRLCGQHLRVISGRHLSKHSTVREEYMEKYDLSPDELIAKNFRIIQSSRRGYQPYGRAEWIAAIKEIDKDGGSVFAGDLQIHGVNQASMIIDDDILKELLQIDDELEQLCKWLNERRDVATSSRLIPLVALVDDLTHILVEARKNKMD